MELCSTVRPISNLPHYRLSTASHTRFQRFHCSFPASRFSGLQYYTNSSLRSSFSDEIPSGASPYAKDGPDGVIILEETRLVENNEYGENFLNEAPKADSPEENQLLQFEFLEKLDIKFDSDDTYSILLLGGGTLAALYLVTAIVRAIDSIPLVPKLLELVGLTYTLWFSTRYLLFEKNREELAAKIEDIKQQIIGSDDD
ncbi:hypothetical protein ACH5RR_012170 [Cinchona calisaya]|uniref:Cyanobacterial aminoacyl-tRNA synthetase CAAD domain-containing protein n=1 Tax=Cinchona calisaya TaxID=153742 RepID=A0ABD3A737_9GENT